MRAAPSRKPQEFRKRLSCKRFSEAWIRSRHFTRRFESPLELPGSDEANDAATEDGAIVVEPGDRLPGIPRHSFKAGVRQGITRAWDVALETIVASSRVFVGDEGNDQPELDGYGVVNLRTAYRFDAGVELFARIDNLFDARYAHGRRAGRARGLPARGARRQRPPVRRSRRAAERVRRRPGAVLRRRAEARPAGGVPSVAFREDTKQAGVRARGRVLRVPAAVVLGALRRAVRAAADGRLAPARYRQSVHPRSHHLLELLCFRASVVVSSGRFAFRNAFQSLPRRFIAGTCRLSAAFFATRSPRRS